MTEMIRLNGVVRALEQGKPAFAAFTPADIDSALAKMGVEPESRAYSPHLTLARIKAPSGLSSFRKEVERLGQPEFGEFVADRFVLYLSKPGPAGSVYTRLSEFPISIQ